jgi:hypothetical protein
MPLTVEISGMPGVPWTSVRGELAMFCGAEPDPSEHHVGETHA